MNQAYETKLRDPRWQRRRLEKMQAAGWRCEMCDDSATELHVHHPFYDLHREPWDYLLEELRCLCSHCHDLIHLPQHKVLAYARPFIIPQEPPFKREIDCLTEALRIAEQYRTEDIELATGLQRLVLTVQEAKRKEKHERTRE